MLTRLVLIATGALLIIYDGFSFLTGGLKNTISWQITQLSQKYLIIPFGFGLLMGHFFGQLNKV
jgi:hypothetical protein